ncbi:hypothetical protein WJX77_005806 [Trebouxia sp. C0004]
MSDHCQSQTSSLRDTPDILVAPIRLHRLGLSLLPTSWPWTLLLDVRRVWPLERLLDEDAYNQVAPVMQFQRTIQVQQQRITELTVELQETNNKLHDSRALKRVADQRITEMTQELENNAVVFKMHYSELIAKEEEIARLKAIIQGLAHNK